LQKVLSEQQIKETIQRETSRADRTGRQFSVVLFGVKRSDKRWSVSTCRMARVLLNRVRQTDDVGWFDDRHLCAILPDTPAAGARIFAARTCDEIARRQPRPTSIVYGYPGSFPFDGDEDDNNGGDEGPKSGNGHNGHNGGKAHVVEWRNAGPHLAGHSNGNGRHHGNGGGNGNGNGHARATAGHSIVDTGGALAVVDAPAEAPAGLAVAEREHLVEYFLDGVSSALKQPKKSTSNVPDVALEDSFVEPMPLWKRAFDLIVAGVGLVLISPILIGAAIAIKLSSPGPVIFKQKRTGLGGKIFTIYKFRTMCVNAEKYQAELRKLNEQDGPAFKLTNDPRVFKVGKILRKTSIDELPQLINVLKGDMSLVGPRPLPVKEQDGCEQWQRHRLNVTPGLTCIWQVDGRSEVTFDEWVRMDVSYMRQRSLWSDISILLRTVPSVLMRKGAK
jgi:lipopolysaccharide/colanic/teichoic acid biosynthesis glycosyltransferase